MWQWLKRCEGGVAIYVSLFAAVGTGAGALAIDLGRVALLQTEMQNRADAAALAAAAQLDGRDGARQRADQVAFNATTQLSNVPSGGATLTVTSVEYFRQVTPALAAATSDLDAKFVRVTLTPQQVQFMLLPVLSLISTSPVATSTTLNAEAIATTAPFVCNAPPLMMCDLDEVDPALDPTLPANIGRQVRLKEPQEGGNGSWAPGNFGLLALPDGSSGASQIEGALAAVTPPECYSIDVITATGSKTNRVKNGINARFDVSPLPDPPAPNVIAYPKDPELIADVNAKIGSGNWNAEGYWTAKHGGTLPAQLAGATRYQTYLYELGVSYAQNGRQTVYPIPRSGLPEGFTEVTPPPAQVPVASNANDRSNPDFDGVPQRTPAPNGPDRRLVRVALLQCIADGVNGHGTYPTYGRYVEMFVTEQVRDPPDAAIYGEIVRPLTSIDPSYHANVRLVR